MLGLGHGDPGGRESGRRTRMSISDTKSNLLTTFPTASTPFSSSDSAPSVARRSTIESGRRAVRILVPAMMTMVMTMLSRRVAPVWSASLRYLPPLAPLTPLGPKLGSSRSLATSDHHEHHQATSSSLDFDKARKRVERLVSRYRRLVERANEGDNGDGTVHEEIGRLHPVVSRYERLEALRVERGSASGIAADPDEDDEMRALAREESESLGREIDELEFEVVRGVLPQEDEGTKEILLEVRAGTGGEEAALFASDLLQMYQRLSQRRGWRFQVLSAEESEHGGFREAVAEVSGPDCYNRMRYESGIHR